MIKNIVYVFICSIAIAQQGTDYKFTCVCLSFCQSVCKHSYGRNFDSILMKFCTVVRGPKCKIRFVWDINLITPSPILPQFKKIALRPMDKAKRYNSVHVKDNRVLCLLTPLFLGSGNLKVLFEFTLYRPCCHSNHSKVSTFCPYFRARAM